MLKITFDLMDFENVEVVTISDVHIGNPLCDIGALKDTVEYILEEPNDPKMARICILNGDLTESVTRKSVGNIFEMTMTPQLQVATMIEMLKPLAVPTEKYPQGKILSYCGGNHDTDRYKDTGITASESIAVGLGIEDRYSPDGCYSFIRVQRVQDSKKTPMVYTLYNQHMTGGAGTVGGKANRLAKISNGIVADLIVGSHFHTPITFKEDIFLPNEQNRSVTQKTITYLLTNAFLKYGDYSQRMGMKPSTISVPKVYIKQTRERTVKQTRFFKTEVLL